METYSIFSSFFLDFFIASLEHVLAINNAVPIDKKAEAALYFWQFRGEKVNLSLYHAIFSYHNFSPYIIYKRRFKYDETRCPAKNVVLNREPPRKYSIYLYIYIF